MSRAFVNARPAAPNHILETWEVPPFRTEYCESLSAVEGRRDLDEAEGKRLTQMTKGTPFFAASRFS
jgi:hypothetical protein